MNALISVIGEAIHVSNIDYIVSQFDIESKKAHGLDITRDSIADIYNMHREDIEKRLVDVSEVISRNYGNIPSAVYERTMHTLQSIVPFLYKGVVEEKVA